MLTLSQTVSSMVENYFIILEEESLRLMCDTHTACPPTADITVLLYITKISFL